MNHHIYSRAESLCGVGGIGTYLGSLGGDLDMQGSGFEFLETGSPSTC